MQDAKKRIFLIKCIFIVLMLKDKIEYDKSYFSTKLCKMQKNVTI